MRRILEGNAWIVMKPLIFALCAVFAFRSLSAQTSVWQPSPGRTQVPIWRGAVPDAQPATESEATHWWPKSHGLRWKTSRGLR